MIGFYVKKILGALLQPLPVVIIVFIVACFYLYRKQFKRAFFFNLIGLVSLVSISTPWLPNPLTVKLERQYHQFDMSQSVDVVVVLGCGHTNDGQLPITAQLAPCSLYRITEGIRIYRNSPDAKILTSGYGGNEPFSNARTTMEFAIAMGVPANDIVIEERPKDTEEEARLLKPKLVGKRFALVTSASHMQRALEFFRREGLDAIPAPTGYNVGDDSRDSVWNKLPNSNHLYKSERLIYEYLGQAWQWLKNIA